MTPTMHGRSAELRLLCSLFNELRGRAWFLVLHGRAGIGKTTLWQAAKKITREQPYSYQVLATRAVEAEATLPFAGLVDLLEGVVDEHLADLPVPQRRALEMALLRRDPTELATDRLAVSLAFLAVLRSIASTTPAIIAVDDQQWLDRPSARVLAFALRRLNEESIGLLATLRSEIEGPLPLELDQAIPASRLRRISLDGLPVGALDQVLRDRMGLALARPALARLHQVTDGNPFYALELARALPASARLTFGEPIPVPGALAGLLRTRLDAVSRQCQAILLAAAALAQPTVALLEQVDRGEHPLVGWREGLAAGVLERDGDRIRFSHPLRGCPESC